MPVGSIQTQPAPCPKCGHAVTPPAPPATQVTCPNCGTKLTLEAGALVVLEDA